MGEPPAAPADGGLPPVGDISGGGVYVATAHPPTAVVASVAARLSDRGVMLVVAHRTHLALFETGAEGLTPGPSVPVYGRIATLSVLRQNPTPHDWLLGE